MKDHCNALFFTKEELASHEIFCHSEHPLGGGDFSEIDQTDKKTSSSRVEEVAVKLKEPTEEDDVYKTMLKMSSEFFGEFLGRERVFERSVLVRERG